MWDLGVWNRANVLDGDGFMKPAIQWEATGGEREREKLFFLFDLNLGWDFI